MQNLKTDKTDFDFLDGVTDLSEVAQKAFSRLSFTFTKKHLENIIHASLSPDASENDKYVCSCILKNAQVASEGTYPLCQDTGIANIYGWKKGTIGTAHSYEKLSDGIKKIYDEKKLRFSTTVPSSFYDEYDPHTNLPAQISIFDADCALAPTPAFIKSAPEDSLGFIFCAKGGGSSNKTSFIQGTKATLTNERFTALIKEQLEKFGTSACPPYTIAIVAGGLSPEQNMLTLKLATMGAYDDMTYEANDHGFRDKKLEDYAMKIAEECGYGSQFGGSQFALETIVIRLPRHGASCPISFGVSCSAHRNLKAILTKDGLYIEKTVQNPAMLDGFSKAIQNASRGTKAPASSEIKVKSNGDMNQLLASLSQAKVGDRILLSGKLLVARDAAHSRWQKLIDSENNLPEYTKKYPICYAGPSRTPEGKIIGSFGPTTAGRMDTYAESLMSRGAALVTLAKGNRSQIWIRSCKKYGAFYLGTPGGIAALIASEYIKSQKILDYEDLGMEAVRLVEVQDLPCFVITDNKGEDFYERH